MKAAFKDWAVVADALGKGEQIFILRKGGIHEGRGGFKMEHDEFALFPTLFHQQRAGVVPAAQARFDALASKLQTANNTFFLQYFCRVEEWHHLENFSDLERLRGQHIWREEVLHERFEWGREKGIFAIAVRVYQLTTTLELPLLPEYGGCKSWIQLAHEVPVAGAVPVLDDGAFASKLSRFRSALQLAA